MEENEKDQFWCMSSDNSGDLMIFTKEYYENALERDKDLHDGAEVQQVTDD